MVVVGAVLLAFAGSPAAAAGAETVTLHTSFSPDRLGASTTIGFGFEVASSDGGPPSPLQSVSLSLPAGIDYLSTTLGLAICQPATLLERGLAACSPNSRPGIRQRLRGSAFGQGAGYEIPHIQALMGPPHDGNIVVLFYADGREPVDAQIVFEGELIAGSQTFGGSLDAAVPLIPSVAGGPPVSIVSVSATIGPADLTYYERVHGHMVSFHPTGVSVPLRCPRGGFPSRRSSPSRTGPARSHARPCPARGGDSLRGVDGAVSRCAGPGLTMAGRSRPRRRVTLAGAFARAAVGYWLAVFPRTALELRRWRRRATRIADPGAAPDGARRARQAREHRGRRRLRHVAPGRRRGGVVRALVAFQVAYDYVDTLAEQPSADPVGTHGTCTRRCWSRSIPTLRIPTTTR